MISWPIRSTAPSLVAVSFLGLAACGATTAPLSATPPPDVAGSYYAG
jgi:hypothetical protein